VACQRCFDAPGASAADRGPEPSPVITRIRRWHSTGTVFDARGCIAAPPWPVFRSARRSPRREHADRFGLAARANITWAVGASVIATRGPEARGYVRLRRRSPRQGRKSTGGCWSTGPRVTLDTNLISRQNDPIWRGDHRSARRSSRLAGGRSYERCAGSPALFSAIPPAWPRIRHQFSPDPHRGWRIARRSLGILVHYQLPRFS
jgi:hypothetical protein